MTFPFLYISPISQRIRFPLNWLSLLDNAILDVRTQSEWDAGHIVNATLALNLANFGSENHEGAVPSDLSGCEYCTIVIYCRTGRRAGDAIQVLMDNGFEGKLYNGQGTSQWSSAGYELVTEDSVVPNCSTGAEQCILESESNDDPSSAKSSHKGILYILTVLGVLIINSGVVPA